MDWASMWCELEWTTSENTYGWVNPSESGYMNLTDRSQMIYIYVICYSVSFPLSKLSVLLFYRRIFVGEQFQRTVAIIAAVFGAFWIAQIFAIVFVCKPISFFWDQVVDPTGGKCVNIEYLYYSVNVINILIDCVLLTLPISRVWKLQMPKKQKIAICGIFMLGSL